MRRSTEYRRSELCRDALRVIECRFADAHLSLAAVAAEIATSARQLQRVLAEAGGTSFRRELHLVRMRHAAELLRDGRRPVKEVAAAVGYRHATQFAKAFQRQYGVTPSSFQDAGHSSASGSQVRLGGQTRGSAGRAHWGPEAPQA